MQHGPRSCRTISYYSLVFSCTAQIYNNGYVSLGTGTTGGYTPRPFPFRGAPMIAPYWADVDTRATGGVYYKNSVSSSERIRAGRLISSSYCTRFHPTSLYIVTWYRVGAYSRSRSPVNAFFYAFFFFFFMINLCNMQRVQQ